jgi:hypothetical protein
MRYKDLFEYDDLNKEKQEIIQTISGLTADNKEDADILDRIWKVLNSGTISDNINNAFDIPLADERIGDKQKVLVRQDMTKILTTVESDYKSMSNFLKRLETGGAVDIGALSKPMNTFGAVFGDDTAIQAFRKLAAYGVGKNQKGPGEYALAAMSNKIRLADGAGDLEIDGIGKVELKAAMSSSGGRIGYGGGSQKAKQDVLKKYAERIPTVMASINPAGSLGIGPFITALNDDLPANDPDNQKIRKALMLDLLTMDMENYAQSVADTVSRTENPAEIEQAYLAANFEWYKNRDDFDALLIMSIASGKTACIKNANELAAFRTSGHSKSTAISIIPTKAGAGREQWAQLTPNAAKL